MSQALWQFLFEHFKNVFLCDCRHCWHAHCEADSSGQRRVLMNKKKKSTEFIVDLRFIRDNFMIELHTPYI